MCLFAGMALTLGWGCGLGQQCAWTHIEDWAGVEDSKGGGRSLSCDFSCVRLPSGRMGLRDSHAQRHSCAEHYEGLMRSIGEASADDELI